MVLAVWAEVGKALRGAATVEHVLASSLTVQPEIPTNLSGVVGHEAEMDRHASLMARAPGRTMWPENQNCPEVCIRWTSTSIHRKSPGCHEGTDLTPKGKKRWLWMHCDL